MIFQRNVWYVAARPEDVDRQLCRRIILNDPVLLFRTEGGTVVALRDQCPHRFAPLSRGRLFGDVVQCRYHGLRFDQAGRCVLNPHSDVISAATRVPSYPTAERYGLVWIWLGDVSQADPERIPDVSYMVAAGNRTVHSYIRTDYRYDILIDNLLDLSHAEYLHVGSFVGGLSERSNTVVREEHDDVIVVRTSENAPAPAHLADLGAKIDQRYSIHWHPGQVIDFEIVSMLAGAAVSTGRKIRFSHIATPETAETTHYFIGYTRDYALDDPKVDVEVARRQLTAIQSEDNPMLDAIGAQMHGIDFEEMQPVMLPVDVGALRVRRTMKRLIAEERALSPVRE
jgi:phenylpropionate dioxygenase-like ring-hydroxylating dioxygenase large terminal subunit